MLATRPRELLLKIICIKKSYLKLKLFTNVMVPTLRTIMNSSYYYEYQENIHLGVELTPAKHFGSQTNVQHSFTNVVFILSFNILVSRNPEFMPFFWTFYWSITTDDYH